VLTLRPRALKVVRVSPGFWKPIQQSRSLSGLERSIDRRSALPIYKPLGLTLAERKKRTVFYDEERSTFSTYHFDFGRLADHTRFRLRGAEHTDFGQPFRRWFRLYFKGRGGWRPATLSDIDATILADDAREAAQRPAAASGVHSIRFINPRSESFDLPPGSLDPSLEHDLEWVSRP
jgi:hypothetical protein